jgi:pimeloyl-ACP methyl ester carboxylesterase
MEVSVGGTHVGYDVIGDGRPVVLLHGLPSTRKQMIDTFEPIFARRSGWQRIYPDLPGMGTTPGTPELANQDAILEVVGEFVDMVAGGGRFVMIGSSYGGYTALGYNYRWGKRLAGLMLSEPMIKSRVGRQVPEQTILVEDADLVKGLQPDEEFWTQVAVIQSADNLEFFRNSIKPGFIAADQDFLAQLGLRISYSFDLAEAAPMTAPALIVAGRQDHITGYRDIWDILGLFPRSTFAILDRAGHAVSSEQRSLFTALTHEFLDRVEESLAH